MAGVAVLATASCTRSGPPAPLEDYSGIYYASPAGGGSKGQSQRVETAPRNRRDDRSAPSATASPVRTAKITSEKLTPPPRPTTVPSPSEKDPPSESAPSELPPATGKVTTTAGRMVTVRKGDTLFAISRREKIPIRALIDANNLKPPFGLLAGQKLRVPRLRVYTVAKGDTVYGISRRFDIGINDVVRQNELKPPDFGLFVGQRIVLPVDEGTPRTTVASKASRTRTAALEPMPRGKRAAVGDPNAKPPPRSHKKFLWPLQGKLVSSYGAKGGGLYNEGINIAAKPGEIVRAAENGVVAYAGNELRGYGNLLLLRHAGGWITAYAHNGRLLVRPGQRVKRGQPIALVGKSGSVTTPQLHFELRKGRKAVDPRRYLG